jgi:hypothetical protein
MAVQHERGRQAPMPREATPLQQQRTVAPGPKGGILPDHHRDKCRPFCVLGPGKEVEPMITPERLRRYVVGVRMSPLERRTLEGVAEQERVSLSEVVRRAVVREAQRSLLEAEGHALSDDN